jgi:hypothetical protein
VQENKQTISFLLKAYLIINTLFVAIRVAWMWPSFTATDGWMYGLCASLSALIIQQMNSMSRATYDTYGSLKSEGMDLNSPGLIQYLFDLVYLCWLSQLMAVFTRYGWFVLVIVPVYGGYKVYTLARPYLSQYFESISANGNSSQGQQLKSKRQEKLEKRHKRI